MVNEGPKQEASCKETKINSRGVLKIYAQTIELSLNNAIST